MNSCPDCNTVLEPFEISCHGCGKEIAHEPLPVVAVADGATTGAEESLNSWLKQGNQALLAKDFGRAAVDFQEALKRCLALKRPGDEELTIRFNLAKSLEGLLKIAEACEQYRQVINLAGDAGLIKQCQEKVSEYEHLLVDEDRVVAGKYKPARLAHISYAPLYCAQCKRMFTEGEVYWLRRQLATNARNMSVHCYCGFAGMPMVKEDYKLKRAYDEMMSANSRRSAIIAAANCDFATGKKQYIAASLAVFFGGFGVHRFYLGEKAEALWYLIFCWTFIPWAIAIFESMELINMSHVSFNLTYNVELVLASLPTEKLHLSDHAEVFSMEITEDAEDFIDEYSK